MGGQQATCWPAGHGRRQLHCWAGAQEGPRFGGWTARRAAAGEQEPGAAIKPAPACMTEQRTESV